MIVDCALYEDGHRRPGELSMEDAAQACKEPGAFVWIGVHDPTPEEFEAVSHELGLHELAVEDAIKAQQRPKIDDYDGSLFVVLKTAVYKDPAREIGIGDILLFVSEQFVVSVRHGEIGDLRLVRSAIEKRPDLLKQGPAAVLYAIVDHVVDGYPTVIEGIDNDISEVEEEVFSDSSAQPTERIYKLKREVLEFHRAVAPLAEPTDGLSHGDFGLVSKSLQSYFRDVHDHTLRCVAQLDGFRELLTNILQANFTQVNIRQNEDMRKISAWVAIFAVPTMIAGIYGMNFKYMPELNTQYGYPAVLLVILGICVVLYWRFRRAGWL